MLHSHVAISRLLLLSLTACSFLLGRLVAWNLLLLRRVGTFHTNNDTPQPHSNKLVTTTTTTRNNTNLKFQIQDQQRLQRLLQDLQHPHDCDKARIMIRGRFRHPKDGFASELQYFARILQASLSTQRTLVITTDFRSAYEPKDCQWHDKPPNTTTTINHTLVGWNCIWKPVSNCTGDAVDLDDKTRLTIPNDTHLESTLLEGVTASRRHSAYFSAGYYGPRRVVGSPINFLPNVKQNNHILQIDVLPHYERHYGRMWVRAQMAHYLWKPSDGLQSQIQHRLPPLQQPYIGFHIRLTDNIQDLDDGFLRNATATRTLTRFMDYAQTIRDQHSSKHNPLSTIYLATDNSAVVQQATHNHTYNDWTFVLQNDVKRTTRLKRMWFREGRSYERGAIAADLEVLRRADYLVGSYQSNVYRLATQLNTAWHVHNYSIHQKRHWTVDIEWYEDP